MADNPLGRFLIRILVLVPILVVVLLILVSVGRVPRDVGEARRAPARTACLRHLR